MSSELSDQPITKFTLHFERRGTKNEDGLNIPLWVISCPEWHCEVPTVTPASTATEIVSQIQDHNWSCSGVGNLKTYTSPLKFDPDDEDIPAAKCSFCGGEMGDDPDGEPVTLTMHTRCRRADRAEYDRDAARDQKAMDEYEKVPR